MFSILLNGESKIISYKTLAELVQKEWNQDIQVATAVNDTIIPKSQRENTLLKPNDRVEIIMATCGG